MGMQKAAVLPVPVCAWPIRSMPSRALGISPAWMGVGSRYSASSSEASMTFDSPMPAKAGRRPAAIAACRGSGPALRATRRMVFFWFCQDRRYRFLQRGHVGSQLVRLLVQAAQVVKRIDLPLEFRAVGVGDLIQVSSPSDWRNRNPASSGMPSLREWSRTRGERNRAGQGT